MSKISIISINLGNSVESLIDQNLTDLSNQTKAAIKDVIAEQQRLDDAKKAAVGRERQKEQETTKTVAAVFDYLHQEAKLNRPVLASRLLAMATAANITNLNSLNQRLRSYLKSRGNDYRLLSCKVGKHKAYTIIRHNLDDQDGLNQAQPATPSPDSTSP